MSYCIIAVSYTHLDVYKRQTSFCQIFVSSPGSLLTRVFYILSILVYSALLYSLVHHQYTPSFFLRLSGAYFCRTSSEMLAVFSPFLLQSSMIRSSIEPQSNTPHTVSYTHLDVYKRQALQC